MCGISFINIIETDNLELETTIKISENIIDLRLLNNNYIVFVEQYKALVGWKQELKFYLTKIWIDFDYNDLIKKESNEITDELGEYKALFRIFSFGDTGLATITEQNKLTIYNSI